MDCSKIVLGALQEGLLRGGKRSPFTREAALSQILHFYLGHQLSKETLLFEVYERLTAQGLDQLVAQGILEVVHSESGHAYRFVGDSAILENEIEIDDDDFSDAFDPLLNDAVNRWGGNYGRVLFALSLNPDGPMPLRVLESVLIKPLAETLGDLVVRLQGLVVFDESSLSLALVDNCQGVEVEFEFN